MQLDKLQFEYNGKQIDLTPDEAYELYLELKKHFGKNDYFISPMPIAPCPNPNPEPLQRPWEAPIVYGDGTGTGSPVWRQPVTTC